MEGPPVVPRVINGVEIIYGTRSASDMGNWACECGTVNEAMRMLVFDIAPMSCAGCNKPNPTNFSICLATVRINNIALIDEVKNQEGPNCVAYSISHMAEIINRVIIAISSNEPDIKKASCVMDPRSLYDPYNVQFPKGGRGGGHKVLHMLQRLTMGIGIQMKHKSGAKQLAEHYFRGSEVRMIHCDDFGEVCKQIADGNPVLAPFHFGANYTTLEYCTFYTAIPNAKVAEHPGRLTGHIIVLIGAVSQDQHRGYFGLEQSGKTFCKQVGVNKGWKAVTRRGGAKVGGYGKIHADSSFMTNFFKVSRPDDVAVPPKLYETTRFIGREEVSEGMMDLLLEPEAEDSLFVTDENMAKLLHGRHFTRPRRRD